MKPKESIRLAEQHGWKWIRGQGKGSHRKYEKDNKTVVIPYHRKELAKSTQQRLLKSLGLK